MSNDFSSFVATVRERRPHVAVILGSGLSDLASRLQDAAQVPYEAVPGLANPSVAGHHGSLWLGQWAGRSALVFAGRLHYYEGHPWSRVVRPVHLAGELGIETLLITNAAGGIRADLAAGDLMAITAWCAWTGPAAWRRVHSPTPLESSPALEKFVEAAHCRGVALQAGSYVQVTGPTYETPAEIRALRAIGVDAVGMSTACELDAATALGMKCVAISCITNKAAGLSASPIHHEEVLRTAAAQRDRLAALIEAFLQAERRCG